VEIPRFGKGTAADKANELDYDRMKRSTRQGDDAPLEGARYRRVLRAAEALFTLAGFRGVTMEEVARDASVAKATLYSYFRSKDELFIAVCERMAGALRKAFLDAAESAGPSVDARAQAAVIAKHRLAFTAIRGSAHAKDLLFEKDHLAGEIFARVESEMLAALTATLERDPALAARAARVARAIYFGSGAIASAATTVPELEDELGEFVRTYLRGARATRR